MMYFIRNVLRVVFGMIFITWLYLLYEKFAPPIEDLNIGNTELHYAAIHNNVSRLNLEEFDVNVKNAAGLTALHFATHHSKNNSHIETIKILLKYKANVNIQDNRGDSPVHKLLRNGANNMKVIELVADHGGDFHLKNHFGESPLKARGKAFMDGDVEL